MKHKSGVPNMKPVIFKDVLVAIFPKKIKLEHFLVKSH